MTPMDTRHTTRNTVQHCQMGHALYMRGPIHSSRLPRAVAASHRPWHKPSMLLGATLDTNDRPSGEMNNSATVRKK